MNNIAKDEIIHDLIELGYNKGDILNGINDTNIRLSWNISSFCLIYSRKSKKWCNGKIIDVYMDKKTNQKWLTVKYSKTNKKKIQRFNKNIKPANLNFDSNQKIMKFILNKLNETNINNNNNNNNLETAPITINLSIFKEKNDRCRDFVQCSPINRLLNALKYYAMLDISNNQQQQEIFADFINNIYSQQLLSDYTHLVTKHGQYLEKIHSSIINNKMFTKCNIKRCDFTTRHQSERRNNDGNKDHALDPILSFYKETMDSLHFYLFHCFDAGVRTKKPDNNNDDEEEKGDRYFDAEFNRIHRIVSEKRNITKTFDRFKANNTTFSIVTTPVSNHIDGNVDTFLDEIYKHLVAVGVKNHYIEELRYFVNDQQYETDAIQYDVDDDNDNDGNIQQHISNKHCIESIKEFVQTSKSYIICKFVIYSSNLLFFEYI